jgi:dolichol-phosphate mannosyltransferase
MSIPTPPALTIVLPTYNERDNLAELIPNVEVAFRDTPLEIIVVDDSSTDGTPQLLADLATRYGNLRTIVRPALLGIGSALREGYNAACGEYILSSDSDQSFTVEDMVRLHRKIQEGYDLVTGFRHGDEATYETRAWSTRVKYLVSRLGNLVVRAASGIPVRDFSANFRVIRRDKWVELQTRENTNALLVEMIVKARRKGFRMAEIPIAFYERRFGTSKLNLWREAPKFLVKFVRYTFLERA